MKIRHIIIILSFSLLTACSGMDYRSGINTAQLKAFNTDSLIREIDQNLIRDTVEADILGLSEEGTHAVAYYTMQKKLCKLLMEYFGETGKEYRTYYIFNDTLIFQKIKSFRYSKPMYYKDYRVTTDSTACRCPTPGKCNDSLYQSDLHNFKSKLKER
jgi:hypothetical protein